MFRPQLGALALLAAFALPLSAAAQTVPVPVPAPPAAGSAVPVHHHHHNRMRSAMRGLNLSDAQRQQIAGLMKSTRQSNRNADPQTRKANMLALRGQIDGVLTAGQRTQFHANLAHQRQQHPIQGPMPGQQTPPQ